MRFSSFYHLTILSAVLTIAAAFLLPAPAHATFISPTRIVIDSNEVAGELVILNRNPETYIYTFKWQDRAMSENGKVLVDEETKENPEYRPATSYLVYSPRQVILGPGETQRIRFFAKRNQMTEGEYRSHIIVGGKPAKEREEVAVTEGMGGSIGVIAQAGIPVMVRHGKTSVEIEPEVFELIKEGENDYMHAKFVNKSTRTLYAHPVLFCKKPELEEPLTTELLGIRMYQEVTYFDEKIKIPTEDFDVNTCASVWVELKDKFDFEYKAKPFYTYKFR